MSKTIKNIRIYYQNMGTVASFIFINGLVIASLIFVVLHFKTTELKRIDAQNMTRDIFHETKQSIETTKNNVNALGRYYAAGPLERQNNVSTMQDVRRLLVEGNHITSFVWATEKGFWHQENIQNKDINENQIYNPASGWPSYQDLLQTSQPFGFNQISYLKDLPWAVFRLGAVGNISQKSVGLLLKLRLPDGSLGLLLAVTTPERIFGRKLATPQDHLARVLVQDRDNNTVVLNNIYDADALKKSILSAVPSNYILSLDEKSWDIQFDVIQSQTAILLSEAPWIAFFLISIISLSAAGVAQRKYQQDKRIAEMSKNLAGTTTELQSKISERDSLFQALRKSERENRAVINSVSDVIFETDENGKLVFLNETWKRMTDHEVADTLGKSLFAMMDAQDQVKQRQMFDELVSGERQAYRLETRIEIGHGNYKAAEISFSMLRMAEDRSIRVVGTIKDIEKRRRAEASLREAEQRFRTIFENSISGIYQTSADGRFISANPALAEIFGYSSADDLMSSVTDIRKQIYVNPEDRTKFTQQALFEGRVSGLETEVYRKDGQKMWIMESARLVRSEKGGVLYYEGSVWDVTERHEAEETMRQARIQAEISSRSRMEFLANMSHELRTPLNAVIGFSEIIKDEVMGVMSIPIYKEYAQDIYESGSHLLKIISEILEVSKIETGHRELNESNFKIEKALKSCMVIMTNRIDEAGVQVKFHIPEDLPEILAEQLGFKQIMLNLVGNAVKFTPKGGKIDISARINNTGEMEVDVADTGLGMTPDEMKKALQPFGKVDTSFSGMKSGTGLGLTIVDSLIRLHGGQFKLMSQKGTGTTARIIFPAARVLTENMKPLSQAIV